MPRISGKARLTTQLKDLWLAQVATEMLHGEDDLGELIKLLVESGIRSSFGDIEGSREGRGGRASTTFMDKWIWNWGSSGEGIEDSVPGVGSGESEGGIGEEIIEGIELMSLIIPAIRYLAPQDPIPRSEFLFHDHVCQVTL